MTESEGERELVREGEGGKKGNVMMGMGRVNRVGERGEEAR